MFLYRLKINKRVLKCVSTELYSEQCKTIELKWWPMECKQI